MVILCLHIPDYPAWALRRCGHVAEPLIVVEKNKVVALSRELTDSEIAVGDHVERAKALEPTAACLERDRVLEAIVLEDVMEEIYRMTPRIMPIRNERFGGSWILVQNADANAMAAYAEKLKAGLGMSHARPYAMISALTAPLGQMVTMPFHKVNDMLSRIPVTRFAAFGFGADMIGKLELFGLWTIRHVMRMERRHLVAQFGPEGERLFCFLHPDGDPQVPDYVRDVLESDYVFEYPVSEPRDVLPVLSHLIDDLANRLEDRLVGRLEIRLTCSPESASKGYGRMLKKPTRDPAALVRIGEMILAGMAKTEMRVDRLSVVLGGFSRQASEQQNLFFKRPGLALLMETMRVRFPGQLLRAALTGVDSTFPEDEAHLVPADGDLPT